jgi:3-hydroxy-9,10-secoandrosta-1,3,5(10)-triene-9,17-dione monooxygenase reductase component
VHVLGAEQKEIAERFAISGDDKFANADWQAGELGSPLLTGCNAQFECRTVHQYEGGDHIIMVGEVLRFASAGTAPLIYHEGQYRSLAD